MIGDLKKQTILAIAQDRMSRQMKEDGTHILSGYQYTPSTHGSRILRQYMAATQMRLLKSIYRQKPVK